MLNVNNLKELISKTKEYGIKFYDFRFTDIKGVWHHLTYNVESVDEDTLKALPLDGSSIPGWQPINQSDMKLIPDFKTAFLDPFTIDTTAIIFCDIYDIYKNQFYDKCPRWIAKKALKYLPETGIADITYFGPENEFFIFDNIVVKDNINCQYYKVDSIEGEWNSDAVFDNQPNTGHRPGTKGGYFPTPPVDTQHEIRIEIVKTLEKVGIKTYLIHHEVAQAQSEIGIKFADLVEAADNIQKYKYVVKMVAHKFGKTATFMPKPLYGDNGSGMHVHQSIWKGGVNLFSGNEYQSLSKMALNYIGGVLKHAQSVAAFTNASTNSYKRLQPGFEAPAILTYSAQNRSASCRIPFVENEKGARAEFRFPDSSANPYLAFSSILLAGIDGIEKEIDPGLPMEINLFELTLDEIRDKGIRQMPHTLRYAIEAMIADNDYLKKGNVFTQEFLDTYQHYKFKTEINPWEERPHPFEFISTYSC